MTFSPKVNKLRNWKKKGGQGGEEGGEGMERIITTMDVAQGITDVI
jgi:hypothetical protein